MNTPPKSRAHFFINAFGWYGVVAILFGYAGSAFELFSVHHPLYLFLNLTGSLGILYEASTKKDWPASVLNSIWALIAFIEILKI